METPGPFSSELSLPVAIDPADRASGGDISEKVKAIRANDRRRRHKEPPDPIMPYEWISPDARDSQAPLHELHLWPHRSLPKRGFVLFIGGTFLLLLLPLYPAIGSPVLWGLLPFLMGTLGLLYWAIQKSYRDGEVLEELRISAYQP